MAFICLLFSWNWLKLKSYAHSTRTTDYFAYGGYFGGINSFTKEQFLRDARMEQPSLVTQYNGYDDAVKILKNRGMIRETYSTEESFEDYSDDALTDMIINSSRFEGNEDIIARVKQELARRKGTIKETRLTNKSLTDYRYKPTNDMDK